MHANSKAAAIAEIIRNDIRRITQNGFLCITQTDDPAAANRTPRLIFTTAGVSPSLTGDTVGSGMIVSYGICDNQAPGAVDRMMWRHGWVMREVSPPPPPADVYDGDPSGLQTVTRINTNTMYIFDSTLYGPPDVSGGTRPLLVPPGMSDVQNLWQCLTTACSQLSIMWTDGTPSGPPPDDYLNWYGIYWNEATSEYEATGWEEPDWRSRALTTDELEFNVGPPPPEEAYRALWTRHNQNNWPKAIRIRFVLTDDSVPEELRDTELGETVYEVICPIGM